MKKLIAVLLCVVMVLSASACSGGSSETQAAAGGAGTEAKQDFSGQTLHFYNPGEYIGDNVLNNFEKLTGCHVMMDEFESNEQMYIKIANGDAYDVIVPSDYMIERLLQEDYLQPLNPDLLDCFDKLDPAMLEHMKEFDPEKKYSVPFFWGTVGIVYDKRKVDEEDLKNEGYGIFADPKYKGEVYLYDSERDMFMVALKHLGYSMNTDNEDELNEAYDFLINIVQTMDTEIVTDEIIDNMAQTRKALGIMYSGDAVYAMAENENVGFYLPDYGTNLWMDCMVIPKNAENVELAHAFINYISDYEAALDNTLTVGYTSPNAQVMQEMTEEGGEYEGIDAYIPRTDNDKDEVFHYNDKARKIIAELWAKVKIAASNV